MRTLSSNHVPVVDYRVRRRRYSADAMWLVRKNEWYEIDDFTDQLWRCCERRMTLEEMALFMAETAALPLNEAFASVVFSVLRFEHLCLLEVTEEASRHSAESYAFSASSRSRDARTIVNGPDALGGLTDRLDSASNEGVYDRCATRTDSS